MSHFEKELTKKELYNGRIFDVATHTVELENGNQAFRDIVYHNGGVCVVAIDKDDNIYLVKQFRFPTGQELYELPAGKLEKGEDSKDAGLRELEEEIGFTTDKLELLSAFYPTPAYCSEKIYIYQAGELIKSQQHLDEDEFLTIVKIPFSEALEMAMTGKIVDAKTQIGILMVAQSRK